MPSSPIIDVRTRTRTTINLDPAECDLIASDDYIIVKDKLTNGEASYLYDDLVREVRPDGMQAVKMGEFNRNKLLTYLIEWSFLDDKGQRLPISSDSINSLDPVVANYLGRLLDKHTGRMAELRRNPKSAEPSIVAHGKNSG